MANDNIKQLQAVLGSPFWREAPHPGVQPLGSSRNPFLDWEDPADFDEVIRHTTKMDPYATHQKAPSKAFNRFFAYLDEDADVFGECTSNLAKKIPLPPAEKKMQPPRPSEDTAKKDNDMTALNTSAKAGTLNPFGNLGLEFGPVPDDKIQMSLYGPAFRRKSGWAAYDGTQMVDVTGTTFPANGLAYKIPAKTLEKGDVILYEEHPFVVLDVLPEGGVRVLSMAGDDERVVRPKTNLLGINFFTKIECLIKLNDVFGADGKGDISQVLMMSMLGNQGGDQGGINGILPLLLLKGLGGEKDGKGGLDPMLLMLMMGGQGGPGAAGGLFGAGGQGGIGQLLLMKALLK